MERGTQFNLNFPMIYAHMNDIDSIDFEHTILCAFVQYLTPFHCIHKMSQNIDAFPFDLTYQQFHTIAISIEMIAFEFLIYDLHSECGSLTFERFFFCWRK